ncbi:hypothetical protein NDU88_005761 [Pleurodeles waltl]|uniref:Uncharacterized protein n=1 Tax=Pleurodeles waltl TaxID=8319 RepID=A0AAV7SMP3_PLEWA|nr:hypothetical protein NDU88_005761 [Pleurodeles waltl]
MHGRASADMGNTLRLIYADRSRIGSAADALLAYCFLVGAPLTGGGGVEDDTITSPPGIVTVTYWFKDTYVRRHFGMKQKKRDTALPTRQR